MGGVRRSWDKIFVWTTKWPPCCNRQVLRLRTTRIFFFICRFLRKFKHTCSQVLVFLKAQSNSPYTCYSFRLQNIYETMIHVFPSQLLSFALWYIILAFVGDSFVENWHRNFFLGDVPLLGTTFTLLHLGSRLHILQHSMSDFTWKGNNKIENNHMFQQI